MNATASSTVAKLSSIYCTHAVMASPGLLLSLTGYSVSGNHSRLATNPFSFIPSVLAISKAEATTLPYLDVHCNEFTPVSPFLSIPFGNTQRLLCISVFQSIERPVTTILLVPEYTTLVHIMKYLYIYDLNYL